MTERGKAVEKTYGSFCDFNYSGSEMACRKHPNSSSVGICAYCLKERLLKLICSECGEQRCSSCSCSDNSTSYRNSCSKMETGIVGRISVLLENEKREHEGSVFLRRSSSGCVEIKKNNGFWRVKKLFRKKRNKGFGKNGEFSDEKSEICVSEIMGFSRSRSLCSFRAGGQHDLDERSEYALSSAKISDVSNGILFDSCKKTGFSHESEPRKTGFRGVLDAENGFDLKWGRRISGPNLKMELDRVFPVKESDFSAMDESAFIDLKLDFLSESKQDFSGDSDHGIGNKIESFGTREILASLKGNGVLGKGDSCRITMNERGFRSHKVWKWISKYHSAAN